MERTPGFDGTGRATGEACLNPNASDYDCGGGTGNGPEYTGTVTVVGYDKYGLDSDGDGIGCEWMPTALDNGRLSLKKILRAVVARLLRPKP